MTEKITTDKFELAKKCLKAANKISIQKQEYYNNNIKLNNAIFDIIDKRSKSKRIALKEYEALANYECPIIIADLVKNIDKERYMDLVDDILSNCIDLDCTYCWKNNLDNIIDILNDNSNHIAVKNLDNICYKNNRNKEDE